MSTWIAHFRIAEQLLQAWPHLNARAFILGNVAPDSGRPNHDWTQFDPPKAVTHLLRPGEDEGRIPDLSFWREHLQGRSDTASPEYAFVLGYFTHLVSDNLWMQFIGYSTKAAFAAEFAADRPGTWSRVKDDWYGLDHKYLRDHPDNVFTREVVPAATPASPLPFLPQDALHHRLEDLRAFYAGPRDLVLDRPYPYLSEASMTRAVQDSAAATVALVAQLQAAEVPETERVSLKVLTLPAGYALP